MEPVIAGIQPTDKLTKKPVMDVVPPRANDSLIKDTVKVAPSESAPASVHPAQQPNVVPPVSVKSVTHDPASGSTVAIIASVIIVLGLGLLLIYAYLRTQGISFF